MKNLKGVTAVITGGASGTGAATASLLSEKGCKVALWDMNLEAAKAHAKTIGGAAFQVDVTSGENVEKALAETTKELGTPRILINCAGILIGARIIGRDGAADLEHFTKTLAVNLSGTYNTMRLCAFAMSGLEPLDGQDDSNNDSERGVIINTASIAAFEGQIGQAAYAASKGGVVSMTLPAAREFGKFGIRVMTIAPGAVETPMMAGVKDDYREAIEKSVPFPSRMAKPEEFAELALHIIQNSYLNGDVIRLDGASRLAAK
jgi:NAD(P)-dependent dehydrogenase (short-subunit alcohol dehydrogenase family)